MERATEATLANQMLIVCFCYFCGYVLCRLPRVHSPRYRLPLFIVKQVEVLHCQTISWFQLQSKKLRDCSVSWLNFNTPLRKPLTLSLVWQHKPTNRFFTSWNHSKQCNFWPDHNLTQYSKSIHIEFDTMVKDIMT